MVGNSFIKIFDQHCQELAKIDKEKLRTNNSAEKVKIEKHSLHQYDNIRKRIVQWLSQGWQNISSVIRQTAKAAKEIHDSWIPVTLKICRLETILQMYSWHPWWFLVPGKHVGFVLHCSLVFPNPLKLNEHNCIQ